MRDLVKVFVTFKSGNGGTFLVDRKVTARDFQTRANELDSSGIKAFRSF